MRGDAGGGRVRRGADAVSPAPVPVPWAGEARSCRGQPGPAPGPAPGPGCGERGAARCGAAGGFPEPMPPSRGLRGRQPVPGSSRQPYSCRGRKKKNQNKSRLPPVLRANTDLSKRRAHTCRLSRSSTFFPLFFPSLYMNLCIYGSICMRLPPLRYVGVITTASTDRKLLSEATSTGEPIVDLL